jgi:hypothetical protein
VVVPEPVGSELAVWAALMVEVAAWRVVINLLRGLNPSLLRGIHTGEIRNSVVAPRGTKCDRYD